jgi:hypothetical protein
MKFERKDAGEVFGRLEPPGGDMMGEIHRGRGETVPVRSLSVDFIVA